MDEKEFKLTIADKTGFDAKKIETLLEAFSKILVEGVDTLTTIAIPSFGSFTPVKYKEEIRTDLSTGKRMMFPPHIDMEFQPAASLRKKVSEGNE